MWGKDISHIERRKIRMAMDVLSEPTIGRRPWSKSSKHSKKKYQPGIHQLIIIQSNLVEISPKIKSEIKMSLYRKKVKEFNTNGRMLFLKKQNSLSGRKEKISDGNMDLYKQTKSTRDQYYNSIHLFLYFLYKVIEEVIGKWS